MRRSTTWPWSSTHKGRFWSWGEATTMPHAWKEPWWAPSAQPPPPLAPEWAQAWETPQETHRKEARALGWGGEGIALWPSVRALLTWRCRLLVSCREGLGALPRALGCSPAPGAIWDSPFIPHKHLLRLAVIVHVWPRRKLSLQKIHLAQDYIVEVINLKFKLS